MRRRLQGSVAVQLHITVGIQIPLSGCWCHTNNQPFWDFHKNTNAVHERKLSRAMKSKEK